MKHAVKEADESAEIETIPGDEQAIGHITIIDRDHTPEPIEEQNITVRFNAFYKFRSTTLIKKIKRKAKIRKRFFLDHITSAEKDIG